MARNKKRRRGGGPQSVSSSSANHSSGLAPPQASSVPLSTSTSPKRNGGQSGQVSNGLNASSSNKIYQVIDSDDNASDVEEGQVVERGSRGTWSPPSESIASTSALISSTHSAPAAATIQRFPMQTPSVISNANHHRNLAMSSQKLQRTSQGSRHIIPSSNTPPTCE